MSLTTTETPPRRARMTPAQRLQGTMAAARLSFTWFGVRKSLSAEQKAEAADAFGAEGQFLSAGKKLLDTRDPHFKSVSAVRSRAVAYWRSVSLPFPEPGLRLIRQDHIEAFHEQMTGFQSELSEAVACLDEHFGQLKAAARARLGRLYNPADYPESLAGLFAMSWEFPGVEPPGYLQELNPELYRQECERVQARFSEAVQLAEQAFLDEFGRLVSHLCERLSGTEDGRPRVFRDSAVGNLQEFFERFRSLNVRSNQQLDELVAQAQQIAEGLEPRQLRDSDSLRQQIATRLATVQSVVEGLLVDQPRRRILRSSRN